MIINNYNYLNTVAKRITGNRDSRDLVSETYISLHGKEVPQTNEEFIKYFSKCMKNIYRWPNSPFNELQCKEILTARDHPDTSEPEPKQYFNTDGFKESLPMHEQILFELSWEKNLSHREIAIMLDEINYTINYKTIYRLCEPIKLKLKDKKWIQLTL